MLSRLLVLLLAAPMNAVPPTSCCIDTLFIPTVIPSFITARLSELCLGGSC